MGAGPSVGPPESVTVGARQVPLLMVLHRRARRYVLRLRPDGSARVTIPRGGTPTAARAFVERHTAWLELQLLRLSTQVRKAAEWRLGAEILFRGETTRLEADESGHVCLGGERWRVADLAGDLRPAIEARLRRLAGREFPARVLALAGQHGLVVQRVTVRDQRTRWGSCSRRGTISLNWRLIMAPAFVQDYLFIHELMHLRQMNHSPRFWREVANACPDYPAAERWLKQHGRALR